MGLYRVFGIDSAYSNIGGNVVVVGAKPDSSPGRLASSTRGGRRRSLASLRLQIVP